MILRCYFDGGSKGNPGPSGYGCHINDEDNKVLLERSSYIGINTNNVAEYKGLKSLLELLIDYLNNPVEKVDKIIIMGDSNNTIKQMDPKTHWNVCNELLPVHIDCKHLIQMLPKELIKTIEWVHIPRKLNWYADRLYNKVIKITVLNNEDQSGDKS